MISVEVDPSDPLPLHEQVAAEMRRAIADGEAAPGDRLPPARYLAEVLGVNHNTVIRALHTLRDEGILEFRRGRGITVVRDAPERSALIAKAKELVKLARRQGYRHDELIAIIETLR
jgi:GntR family transcriptional regulator